MRTESIILNEQPRDEQGRFAPKGGGSGGRQEEPKSSPAKDAAKSIGRGAIRGAGEEAKRVTRSLTERSITRIQNAIIRKVGLD